MPLQAPDLVVSNLSANLSSGDREILNLGVSFADAVPEDDEDRPDDEEEVLPGNSFANAPKDADADEAEEHADDQNPYTAIHPIEIGGHEYILVDQTFLNSNTLQLQAIKGVTPRSDSKSRIKINQPDTFNGKDPNQLCSFIAQMHLNFAQQPSDFPTDKDKVTLSWNNQEEALKQYNA
ncbi:hypothetical protein DL96DRAFT_1723269 [Flagelloscypha sp. PMI_526]|nr:hypothetical protein DL96DRAFT_1723269 [Flagelloscypha sp. PMI_526]